MKKKILSSILIGSMFLNFAQVNIVNGEGNLDVFYTNDIEYNYDVDFKIGKSNGVIIDELKWGTSITADSCGENAKFTGWIDGLRNPIDNNFTIGEKIDFRYGGKFELGVWADYIVNKFVCVRAVYRKNGSQNTIYLASKEPMTIKGKEIIEKGLGESMTFSNTPDIPSGKNYEDLKWYSNGEVIGNSESITFNFNRYGTYYIYQGANYYADQESKEFADRYGKTYYKFIASKLYIVKVGVNKDNLNTNINNAISPDSPRDESDYTPASWNNFKNTLDNAISIKNNTYATQEQVNQANSRLQNAINALVSRPSKTNLESNISSASSKNESDYTPASWNNFKDALNNAKVVKDNLNATQEQVNQANSRLQDAINALVSRPSKTNLESNISSASSKNESDYTQASWNNFKDALNNAKAVKDNLNATQSQINEANSRLQDAINALVSRPSKTNIISTISSAGSKNESDYTQASWNNFKDALDNAKAVKDNLNATQSQINEANSRLQDAINALVSRPSKTNIISIISSASSKNESDYTQASWNNFKDALDNAKAVKDNVNATQEQINQANSRLQDAISALVSRPSKSNLESNISSADSKNESDYTQASWNNFKNALDNAKAVKDNVNATQEQVNQANSRLQDAINALVKNTSSSSSSSTSSNNVAGSSTISQKSFEIANDSRVQTNNFSNNVISSDYSDSVKNENNLVLNSAGDNPEKNILQNKKDDKYLGNYLDNYIEKLEKENLLNEKINENKADNFGNNILENKEKNIENQNKKENYDSKKEQNDGISIGYSNIKVKSLPKTGTKETFIILYIIISISIYFYIINRRKKLAK